MNLPVAVYPLAVALLGVLALTPLVRAAALRADIVARPSRDRWHQKPVPLMGGIAIALAGGGTALLFAWPNLQVVAVVSGALAMAAFGVVDDLKQLKPATKLTAQIAVACGLIAQGVQLTPTQMPVVDAFVSIFWFVAVTNAFNLLDNMDGLCAGIAAIAALAYCGSVGAENPTMLLAGAAVAGAAAGFLVFNFKPASIFMGDGGSMFLGAALAALPMAAGASASRSVILTLVVPALMVLIPIFDTAFVTVSRKLSARAASIGGRDHTSHRLVALGFSERQAVLTLWALAAGGGLVAYGLRHSDVRTTVLLLCLLLVGIVLLSIQLARVNVYGGEDFSLLRETHYARLLVSLAYKRRIFEVLLDCVLISLAYYAAYVLRFDNDFPSYRESFQRSLPIVIATQLASFFVAGVYRGVWRHFSSADMAVHARAVLLGVSTSVVALVLMYRFGSFSRSVFLIDTMALLLLLSGSRAFFRIIAELGNRHRPSEQRAVIFGAGDGGAMLVRELRNNPAYGFQAIAFFDDDEGLWGRRILGLPVRGGVDSLVAAFMKQPPDLLVVSTDKLSEDRLSQLIELARATDVPILRFDFRLAPIGEADSVHVRRR